MAAEGHASNLERVVRDAKQALEALGADFALIGGLAVSARSEPRFTRDADFTVAVLGDRDAEALVRELQKADYRILIVLEQEKTDRLATVRFRPPGSGEHGVILDLLFASSGIEPEIVQSATRLEVFPDLELPVATVGHLLALKILARDDERRPQDVIDIRALLNVAKEGDIATAKRALTLVLERGFNRNRDLLTELERML